MKRETKKTGNQYWMDILFHVHEASGFPQLNWVSWIMGDDIVGSDGSNLTSWTQHVGTADSFITTNGPPYPILKTGSNGINGHEIVKFSDTGTYMVTTTGGESLTGDWYVAALFKYVPNASSQNILSWGNRTDGQRRSMLVNGSNQVMFIGEGHDINTNTSLGSNNVCLVEMWYDSETQQIYISVNGVLVTNGNNLTLNSYSSTALVLGTNPDPDFTEPSNSYLAEAFFIGEILEDSIRTQLLNYVIDKYGL